ncbi:hypothetical protein Pmani_033858 [Petrolisthes manimaculis]|uniref:Uncharacterized protein n=1 Tax=Petrolisthes manimaculis TaxID=1843537 RepID=A0AAE1TQ01_9EUCA|nr:hypothetical protein Pmani_033858 [Petrolisthes manimaculis]
METEENNKGKETEGRKENIQTKDERKIRELQGREEEEGLSNEREERRNGRRVEGREKWRRGRSGGEGEVEERRKGV